MKRRFSTRHRTIGYVIAAVVAIAIMIAFVLERAVIYDRISDKILPKPVDYSHVHVREVVDGDTIRLPDRKRVRLIGIDTPEYYESDKLFRDAKRAGITPQKMSNLGEQSYRFTRKLCEGKDVRLEFGPERFDSYGRLLAFVYLPDGSMLNEEIIRQGYGIAMLRFPFKQEYRDRFVAAQHTARKEGRGLWSQSPGLHELLEVYK